MRPALLVHGGAGRVPEDGGTGAREGLEAAASLAWRYLEEGGPALEAVLAAVQALEEDLRFNAGYGWVLTEDGDIEMDAAVMDGSTLRAGAVAVVRLVRHPILLARAVDALEPGTDPAAVAAAALARMQALTGGTGGLILLDATGRGGAAHTTPFMAVARRGKAA